MISSKLEGIAQRLREKTQASIPYHEMMTEPEQVAFLQCLLSHCRPSLVIELGVFSGYATLHMAAAMKPGSRLLACDHNHEWPQIGVPFWREAQVDDRIELIVAPARDTLQACVDEGWASQVDFIFVDADKIAYIEYFEFAQQLLRPGGMVVFDNVSWVGQHSVASRCNPATRTVARCCELVRSSGYAHQTIPLGAGMLMAVKP